MGRREESLLVLRDRTVDVARGVVRAGAGAIRLTRQEQSMLALLVAREGQIVPRDDLLRRVWGYDAPPLTRAVDIAVQRLRSKLEAEPARPRHLVTVRGEGYRFTGLAPEAAAPRAGNLPAETTRFVGREAERALLSGRFDGGARLVSLVGPPGAGKSRLAREAARRLAPGHPGGVWLVDASAAPTREAVAEAAAAALGLQAPTADPAATVERALAGRPPTLLLVDDLDFAAAAAADLLRAWLAAAAEARVLVTSRERLGLEGEVCVDLAPLPEADAVELFVDRARAARHDFAPDLDAIRTLVGRLDGLPLAIELAAARVRVLPPAVIAARLDDALAVAGTLRRGSGARHETLRAAIGVSWALLSADEQRALAACSTFRGGFDLDAAQAVLEAGAAEAVALLQSLRDKSLLRVDDASGEPRFGLYDSIRAFAAEQLAALDPRGAALARHRRFYARAGRALAEEATDTGRSTSRRRLALERDNRLAARARAREAGDPATAAETVLALGPLLLDGHRVADRLELADGAVADAEAVGDPGLRSAALTLRSRVRRFAHGLDAALADAVAAATLATTPSQRRRAALATGLARFDLGRFAEARAALTEAAAGDDAEAAFARLVAGETWLADGDVAAARADCAAAMTRLEALGARLAPACLLLGQLEHIDGRPADGIHHVERALDLYRADGHRRGEAVALSVLANLLGAVGRHEASRARAEQARRLDELGGDRHSVAIVLGNLASCLLETGATGEVRALGEAALALHAESGDARSASIVTLTLGVLAHVEGDLATARRQLSEARAAFERAGAQLLAAQAAAHLGAVAAAAGDLDAAAETLESAAGAMSGSRHRPFRAVVHVLGGFLDCARGAPERAAARLATFEGEPLAPLAAGCAELRVAMSLLRRASGARPDA